jgi:hypothetical protein
MLRVEVLVADAAEGVRHVPHLGELARAAGVDIESQQRPRVRLRKPEQRAICAPDGLDIGQAHCRGGGVDPMEASSVADTEAAFRWPIRRGAAHRFRLVLIAVEVPQLVRVPEFLQGHGLDNHAICGCGCVRAPLVLVTEDEVGLVQPASDDRLAAARDHPAGPPAIQTQVLSRSVPPVGVACALIAEDEARAGVPRACHVLADATVALSTSEQSLVLGSV